MAAALGPDDLNRLPPIREDIRGLFEYQPLSAGTDPPSDVTAHHRLARRESRTGEDEAGERLRLAFVIGYDFDADWLDSLAYVWRAELGDAVWALERWDRARSLLRLYTRDPTFASQEIARIHRELRERGDDAVAADVREILRGN